MRKKWLFSVPFVFIGIIALFWNVLFGNFIEIYLNNYCIDCFGTELQKESYRLDSNQFTLKNALVQSPEGIATGGIKLAADEITVNYRIHFFSRTVDLDILIDSPRVDLNKNYDLGALIERLMSSSAWIKFRPNFKIHEALVALDDYGLATPSKQKFYFSSAVDLREHRFGHLALSIDDKDFSNNSLNIDFFRDELVDFSIDAKFNNANLGVLAQVFNQMGPIVQDWILLNGVAQGHISVVRPHGRHVKAQGVASINEVTVLNPQMDFVAKLARIEVDLRRKKSEGRKALGRLELGGNSSFSIIKGKQIIWEIQNFVGLLLFERHGNVHLNLEAECKNEDSHFFTLLKGDARLFDDIQTFLNMKLQTRHADGEEGGVIIAFKQLDGLWNSADIQVNNISHREFQFFQKIVNNKIELFNKLHFSSGNFDAVATAFFRGIRINNLNIESLKLSDVIFDYYPWDIYGYAEKIYGSGNVNFNDPDLFNGLNAEINVDKSFARFVGLNKELWTLSDIETKLIFKKGVIQKSVAKGNFAGLEGTIEMDWMANYEIFKLKFSGNPRGLSGHVHERVRRGINKTFIDDHITFSAGVRNVSDGLHVDGILEIKNSSDGLSNDIAFGFDINKTNSKLAIHRHKFAELRHWERLSLDAFKKVMPAVVSPIAILNDHWTYREKGISGYVVKNGWFFGENLPLERFVAPFAFQFDEEEVDTPLKLEGYGDFRGSFDQTGLSIAYGARDVVVESEDFRIEIPQIFKQESSRPDLQSHAFHVVEFENSDHFGSVPLEHGKYIDKNSGLIFSEVSTRMKLEGKQMHVTDIETFCEGIFFAGDINIDLGSPEKNSFDVEIIVDTMNGKVSQVQSLFSHFDKSPLFINFPIEGDIRFRNKGAFLGLSVSPNGTDIQTRFQAVLSDGTVSFSPLDMSLTELEMNIDYNQISNTLNLDDMQGTILVGKPGDLEEYIFSGDKLSFSDFTNNISEFDLWFGHKNRDIMRFVGTTYGKKDVHTDTNWVVFDLDKKLSHFGDVFPANFVLKLKNWQVIEEFQLDLKLRLSTLFNDLKRVARSGIFFLPENVLQELNRVNGANGDFRINLKYTEARDLFTYDAMGSDLKIGEYQFETVLLNGTVKDRVWSIDQLRFDDVSIASEIYRKENSWRVNFLGLRSGNSILMGIEGEYFDGANNLEAKVNLLEINLAQLNEWNQMQAFVEKNSPKGILRGNGKIFIERDLKTGDIGYDGIFALTGNDIVFRDIAFGHTPNFSSQIQKNRGLTIRNISTAMMPPHGRADNVGLHIEKLHYDFSKEHTSIEGLRINIPHQSLHWFAAKMRYAFLEDISENTEKIIKNIKKEGAVNPLINLDLYPDSHLLSLRLPDDIYNYAGEEHILNDFLMTHEPQNMIITTGYRYQQKSLWATFHSRDPNIDKGTIVLSDKKPLMASKNYESIYLKWENDPYYGFNILEAKGRLGGVTVNFVRGMQMPMDANYTYLIGKANLDIPSSLQFCDKEFIEKCNQNKMGGQLALDGRLAFSKNNGYPTRFYGVMDGRNFAFKGYLFDKMSSSFNYTSEALFLQNFSVEDPSVHTSIPQISLKKAAHGYWWMHIPEFHIKNFRPSRLKEIDTAQSPKLSSLIFNSIDIKNISGNIADTKTWNGSGALKFSNRPRTNLQHTILAFPHEIITRIGLNPAVLTPVTGIVFYEIKDGKIVLTKFKDIFSESRGSKFYLPSTTLPSYIDFEGKMYIQVRMKQHNLLFKFAELMTVTVKGTLDNPIYSIRHEKGQNSK